MDELGFKSKKLRVQESNDLKYDEVEATGKICHSGWVSRKNADTLKASHFRAVLKRIVHHQHSKSQTTETETFILIDS